MEYEIFDCNGELVENGSTENLDLSKYEYYKDQENVKDWCNVKDWYEIIFDYKLPIKVRKI